MRTLYIECNMGAAGDMLMAALYELLEDKEGFLEKMNHMGLPGVTIEAETAVKCGITGTHMKVTVDGQEEESHDHHHHHHHEGEEHQHHHHHSHSTLHSIGHILEHLDVEDDVKEDVKAVYTLIAEAESHAHNMPVNQIHFHEVGTMDAVADITGVCLAMRQLHVDRIYASPVHVGTGHVHCAHGILPVPAPATAYILQGIPSYGGSIQGELCTPTGAALLKHFAAEFISMPVMRTKKTGYGMGKKDFEMANCVRAFLGETKNGSNQVVELACNLDDMTAEEMAFAMEILLEEGALDVYITPAVMKKSRPGQVFTCMCRPEDKERMAGLIFRHTTTIGIREYVCNRHVLDRNEEEKETSFGNVRIKKSTGYGVEKEKAEFADRARIAREKGISVLDVK